MNMVWHLLWKDIRRFKWWLVAWFALLGIFASLEMTTIPKLLITLLSGTPLTLFFFIFIIRVVQEDSLAGSTAFWLTRPIKHWHLLLTKTCFVFLLLFLPMIGAESGSAFGRLAWLEHVCSLIMIIFFAWITALCVKRFSTAVIVSIFAWYIYSTLFTAFYLSIPIAYASFRGVGQQTLSMAVETILKNTHALYASRLLLPSLVITIFGAGIVVYHYLTRRITRTVIISSIALILVLALTSQWRIVIFPSWMSKGVDDMLAKSHQTTSFISNIAEPIREHIRYAKTMAKLHKAKTEEQRFHALSGAAKLSFNAGKKEDARKYAEELKALMPKYTNDWNYGNAVQAVNIVFGRIALSEGRIEEAKNYLLEAGKGPGSRYINMHGPTMVLAQELLKLGQKETVLEYFRLCIKLWEQDNGKLKQWAEQVEKGEIPDFGANLVY